MSFASLALLADRAVLATMGDAVSYMPRDGELLGETRTVTGVFSAPYLLADMGEAGVSTSAPKFWCRLADLGSDPETDKPLITVGGVEYVAHTIQKDDVGGVTLLLREAE